MEYQVVSSHMAIMDDPVAGLRVEDRERGVGPAIKATQLSQRPT